MKCPDCGTQHFYVKDPEDQYNISEFTLEKGKIEFQDSPDDTEPIPVTDNTEIFCDTCAWHDTFKNLK